MVSDVGPLFVAYVLVFAAAAVACVASAARARHVEHPDTRRGLVALLVLSGAWAAAHVGFLVAPGASTKTAFYVAGLVVGFAAVGAWLYFCSAYTGRRLHRNRAVRGVAVAAFVLVVLVKLTNPLHGLYFSTEAVSTPFPHLAVHNGGAHWLAMGLAYALAVVGYFMLFELFVQVGADARPLGALAAVTGLPVLLDVAGLVSPSLIDITYEPVGVAAFAVVVLFVYLERFQAIQLAGSTDDPVVVLSAEDRIRDFNRSAADRFPELDEGDAVGEPLSDLLPGVAACVESDDPIMARAFGDTTRYYHVSVGPFTAGPSRLGKLVTVADVTERERYRRELERQNERLARFASVVSHDLRNPLNVAMGRLQQVDGDDEGLAQAAAALQRMEALIEDLLALAREGQAVDETEPVSLSAVVRRAFELVETGDATLEVAGDVAFEADPERFQQLVENLLRNSVEHGSTGSRASPDDAVEHGETDVTIRVGPTEGGFYVEDDGPGIPADDREDVFESGYTTAEDGTGFGLAIVAEIAGAHGWDVRATEAESGGARFEVTGVETTDS